MVVADRTVRVSAAEARSLVEQVLLGVDATSEEACTVANVLVEADLRGQSSHGILRLPTIVERVNARLIRPRATPRLSWAALLSAIWMPLRVSDT
jgi:LDH2 family malate/lactate/ureidoglycolate dehydrogenase